MLAFLGRNKALSVLVAMAMVLVLALVGWVWYLNHQLSEIPRFSTDVPGESSVDRPNRPAGDEMTILLLGADDPDGEEHGPTLEDVVQHGGWEPGAFRSDTIMLLHIDPDRSGAELVSIPRDSWVDIPGYGKNKINAAFSFGGPALMRQTVEQVTDTYIDHVMVVDFNGFKEITEIVDGVEVYVPKTVTEAGHVWTQGTHVMRGEGALRYVRQRYGLPGGDFDRIQRQQNFLRALADKILSAGTLTNPKRLTDLTEEMAKTLAVDEGFTPGDIRSLALSMRGFQQDRLRFLTAPNHGTGTEGEASVVRLDVHATKDLFDAIQARRLGAWLQTHDAAQLPASDEVN